MICTERRQGDDDDGGFDRPLRILPRASICRSGEIPDPGVTMPRFGGERRKDRDERGQTVASGGKTGASGDRRGGEQGKDRGKR